MPRDGNITREKILDAAHELVLGSGFGGTSVDRIIAAAGVTKGTFFYHFPSKVELAHALVARYVQAEATLVKELLERAERLARDPLQQLVLFTGFFVELMESVDEPTSGCLMASFCYQSDLVDEKTQELIRDSVLETRAVVQAKLDEVVASRQPRLDVDLAALADLFLTVFEGAFVLERAVGQRRLIAGQLRHYKNYLELLFAD